MFAPHKFEARGALPHSAVQKALDDHKTLAQMKDEKILAPWQKLSGNFVNSDAFLAEIYNSLTLRK